MLMPIEPLTKSAIETFIQQQAILPLKLDPRKYRTNKRPIEIEFPH
jgi:hypothetical protein